MMASMKGLREPEATRPETPEAGASDTSIGTPDYTDLGELGRGGMGAVHRVRDHSMLREVAMKLLDPELARDSRYAQAFIAEARIGGQLGHPGVVPVYELAVDSQQRPYFTMPIVNGRTFHRWLYDPDADESPDRLADALDIFLKVCDVISFAHSRGVIHRDLKPSNIMVGEFGVVYVMDWGLALVKGEGVELGPYAEEVRAHMGSLTGGTLCYMAPEQLYIGGDVIDARTDVFGLGAILYEIVTGRPPYPVGTDRHTLETAVCLGAWTPPEDVLGERRVSGKLLSIIKKALSPNPDQRYASVAELKEDVQAFLRRGLYLERRGFPPGTLIFSEGASGEEAYLIVRGECAVFKTIDGRRQELRRMGPGEVFGEMAVLSNAPRTASVETLDTVTVLVISRAELEEGFGVDGWVGMLVRSVVSRFRDLDEKVHGK